MRDGRATIQAALDGERKKKPKPATKTFLEFLALHPEPYRELIDNYFGPGTPLPEDVIARLRSSRPLRMFREGLDSILYGQMILDRAPQDSDLRDLHHAIGASLVDGIVTADGAFREWCARVSLPDFEVTSLADLVSSPGVKT
jgi:hypothetical protein